VLEGLDQRVDVVAGEVPETMTVTESGIAYEVDLRRGQKTGLFLDQRENRLAAVTYARGRLLDCFSYNGGFAMVLGRRCTETIAIDASEEAVALVRKNAVRNGVTVDARVGNVFDELRGLERLRERFDTIVLDPPAFVILPIDRARQRYEFRPEIRRKLQNQIYEREMKREIDTLWKRTQPQIWGEK
jgi:23S rRNA (cytosine1962-C5)-methyltransferase